MRKFQTILAISFLTVLPLLSHAGTFGSKILLPGGNILPNQDIEITFKNFLESVIYQVNCEITSDGKSKQNSDYIALYSADHHLQPAINGTPLNHPWQAKISAKEPNHLSLNNATAASASFVIRNLDDTDTITVKNCFALPQV